MRSSLTAMTTVALLYTAVTSAVMTTATAIPTSNIMFNRHIIRIRSSSQKYCGNNIVMVLRLLCDGNYFSPIKRAKQSDHFDSDSFDLLDNFVPKAQYNPPKLADNDINNRHFIISPKQAFNLLNEQKNDANNGVVFNRNRRGIVDECCKKPCTVRELYSYCD